jgi:arylsulfatase A-like enzyme
MRTAASLKSLPESLALALRAGLFLGGLFGLGDGLVAAVRTSAALPPTAFAGCLAAAVFEYCGVAVAALAVFALVFHPAIGGWSRRARMQALLAVGLTAGVFAEIYWWARPFVFDGYRSDSAPRILAALGFLALALLVARFTARPLAALLDRLDWALIGPIAAVFLGGGAYLFAQRDVLADHGIPNERTHDMPNVLLVVVDALRQDSLGCYGSPRVQSPNIDRLAREGVLFENAFTQAPFTWTSFGSMLTGKYPRRHGLVLMAAGSRMVENATLASHFESAVRDDGRALRDDDYLSVSFHTGTLSTGSGLIQGFDLYYEQLAGHGLVVAESAWSVYSSDLVLNMFRAKLAQKAGGDVAGTSREWLAENGKRRFLSMVHLYSTHTPYDPPARFRDLYVDPTYTGKLQAFYSMHREAIERHEATPTTADVQRIRDLYYAGVTQADAAIGDLVAELEKNGTLDDTLVIVTSDHGESLGEESAWGTLWEHNHMVDTNLRIPLVMRWPRTIPAGTRVGAIVDEIDVLPTVCDLAGVGWPPQTDEYSQIDGASLVPLLRGESESVRPYSISENAIYASIRDLRWKLLVPFGLIDVDDWSTAADEHGFRVLLFDLAADAAETQSVLPQQPDEARRLHDALRDWFHRMPKVRVGFSPRDEVDMKRLIESLGYTQSGIGIGGTDVGPPARGGGSGPAPRGHVDDP